MAAAIEQGVFTQEQFDVQSAEFMTEQAQRTRDYVESQVEQWQRLPLLSLMADGKFGWSGDYRPVYDLGVVRVGSGRHYADNPGLRPAGLYGVFVDCDNGHILRLNGKKHELDIPELLASDQEVFHLWATKLALGKMSTLSAQSHVDALEKEISAPLPSWRTPEEEANRQKRIAEIVEAEGPLSRLARG